MNQLLAVICLALWSPAVIDGDTVQCGARIRLTDYDAPELHGRCTHEVRLARLATDELRRLAPTLTYTFTPCATHNHGRLCARASFRDGKPLADYMTGQGLAAPYICGTGCPVKRDWCH
jgi:endonuclease YncB( thermonuclease family)